MYNILCDDVNVSAGDLSIDQLLIGDNDSQLFLTTLRNYTF